MSQETADFVSKLPAVLASAPQEFVAVYLFGSHARNTARSDSDVDLAYWRSTASGSSVDDKAYSYADELRAVLGKEVDLVELNHAPCDLVHEVLREGKLVLERDREARVRFEVKARKEYLDLRPTLLRHRRLRATP